MEGLKEQIINALTDSEGRMSLDEIAKIVGKDRGQIKIRLSTLKKEEKVVNPERGIWALKGHENQDTSFI